MYTYTYSKRLIGSFVSYRHHSSGSDESRNKIPRRSSSLSEKDLRQNFSARVNGTKIMPYDDILGVSRLSLLFSRIQQCLGDYILPFLCLAYLRVVKAMSSNNDINIVTLLLYFTDWPATLVRVV